MYRSNIYKWLSENIVFATMFLSQNLLAEQAPEGLPYDQYGREKYLAGWTLHLDNDLLVPGLGYDQDYTGGIGVTIAGLIAKQHWWSLDPLLRRFDKLIGFEGSIKSGAHILHAAQFGLTVFSPTDIGEEEAIYDDRPFANLLYMSNSRRFVKKSDQTVYQSTLTFGILGSKVGTEIQKGIHKMLGSTSPNGWDHQVSEGGELTFQYSINRQALLSSNSNKQQNSEYELKYSASASAGYITEVSIAATGRWGNLNTPWWSFTPENGDYNSQPAPVIGNSVRENISEFYIWGGFKARVRAYNAFLQGQFRDSDVTFSNDEINHLIGEVWIGITYQIRDYRLSYVLRYQTKEIKDGEGARNPIWGGIILSADF